MTFGLNATPAVELLKEQLLLFLELVRGGQADLARSKIPFSVLVTGFGVNQSALTDDQLDTLAELAETLLSDRALEIDILVGRASQTGTETNNLSLSEARGRAVLDELTALSVHPPPPVVGLGSSQPIVEMPGEESDLNRSVEIRLWYDLGYHFGEVDGSDPGDTHAVDVETYERAWEKDFRNLTDQELEQTWETIRDSNLNDHENGRFHDYFVGTIVNVALERARRANPGDTLREKISRAWGNIQLQLREDATKDDRTNTIYRDAERIVEVAQATLGGTASGANMFLGQLLLYDPGKAIAWGIYDTTSNDWLLRKGATTDDYPSRAGGLEWTLLGFNYAMMYRELSDPPTVPLPTGTRELVQQELLGH